MTWRAWFRSAVLLALAPVAPGSEAEPDLCTTRCGGLPAVQAVRDPGLRGKKAHLVGAAIGFALGRGLRERSPEPHLLRGWRGADAAVIGGAAFVQFALPRLWRHTEPELGDGAMSDCVGTVRTTSALGPLDRALRGALAGGDARGSRRLQWRKNWGAVSDVSLGATLALGLGASHARLERDLLVVVGSVGAAGAVTDRLKHLTHRPRPFLYHCAAAEGADLCEEDAQLSFPSGHAAMSFAAAVAAGRIADFRGSKDRGRIWATGLTLATTTGLLRIAADKHHASDVVVGAALGGLAGWYIPKLHKPRPRESDRTEVSSLPSAPAMVALPLRLGTRRGLATFGAGLLPGGAVVSVGARW